jgi:SAM-dependent methyltransferase
MAPAGYIEWKKCLGLFVVLFLCVTFVGCHKPVADGPIFVEYPESFGYTRVKAEVAKIQAQNTRSEEREIRFVTSPNQILFAFYREGMVHMRTDRALEVIARIYPLEFLSPQNLSGKTILDLGCGNGSFVSDLRETGYQAFGIDLFLEEHLVQEPFLTRQDLRKTSFESKSFDRIFCTYVLLKKNEYDKDFFQSGLAEALRIARDDAIVYIGPTLIEQESIGALMEPFEDQVSFRMVPVKSGYAEGKGFKILVIEVKRAEEGGA